MKFYPLLSDDDIQTICQEYPPRDLIAGFKKYSKDFSALLPGRRPQSVEVDFGRNLISNNPHSNLTAKMVESLLKNWIPKTKAIVEEIEASGKNAEYAHVVAFSRLGYPFFVSVYFNIIESGFSEDQIHAIQAGAEALTEEMERMEEMVSSAESSKQLEDLRKQFTRELKEKDQDVKGKAAEIKRLQKCLSDAQKTADRLFEKNEMIGVLQSKLGEADSEIAELKAKIHGYELQLTETRNTIRKKEEQEQECFNERERIKSELVACQTRLDEIEQARKATLALVYNETIDELRPIDLEEFDEYLSYNLTSLGLEATDSSFSLLLNYLHRVIFANKPILCSHAVGLALARCISNTICGTQNVTIVPYKREITNRDIISILETDSRILVFDSFIGNYSEKELLPILRRTKGKIIIVTAEYDKTIALLLPEEVLCNCTYINASRFPGLLTARKLDEDPSTLVEDWFSPSCETPDRRSQRLCREIMKELGFSAIVTETMSAQIGSAEVLDGYLAFSILPYYIEASGASPYSISSRLGKYAGPTGKSNYRELLMEWYGND